MSICMAVLLPGCATGGDSHSPPTLKGVFKKDFLIGVAINRNQATGKDTNGVALITSQFDAISPENDLKWEIVQPRPGTNGYNFESGDAYVAFGEQHHMFIVGHTLVWHNQTPRWVFQNEQGRMLNPNQRGGPGITFATDARPHSNGCRSL